MSALGLGPGWLYRELASGDSRVTHGHEVSQWLRSIYAAGPRTTCPHITLPYDLNKGPRATWALWGASRIRCRTCPTLAPLPRGGVQDRTCDRCGYVCPDIEGQRIGPTIHRMGRLTVLFGLCPACGIKEMGPE